MKLRTSWWLFGTCATLACVVQHASNMNHKVATDKNVKYPASLGLSSMACAASLLAKTYVACKTPYIVTSGGALSLSLFIVEALGGRPLGH